MEAVFSNFEVLFCHLNSYLKMPLSMLVASRFLHFNLHLNIFSLLSLVACYCYDSNNIVYLSLCLR